jgi:hypothetical protein
MNSIMGASALSAVGVIWGIWGMCLLDDTWSSGCYAMQLLGVSCGYGRFLKQYFFFKNSIVHHQQQAQNFDGCQL